MVERKSGAVGPSGLGHSLHLLVLQICLTTKAEAVDRLQLGTGCDLCGVDISFLSNRPILCGRDPKEVEHHSKLFTDCNSNFVHCRNIHKSFMAISDK